MTYIYSLNDPTTNEVRYIGKTVDLKVRLKAHLKDKRERTHKTNWIERLESKDLKPRMEVLAYIHDDSRANEWERWYIKTGKELGWRLTNSTDGGELGSKPTEEVKKKMSLAHKGKKLSLLHRQCQSKGKMGNKNTLGHELSESHKKKIGEANKGKKLGWKPSEKTRKKMSLAKLGKKLSIEHKRRLSESQKLRWRNRCQY